MNTKAADMRHVLSTPRTGMDASNLLVQDLHGGRFLEEVELRIGEQTRVFLGVFDPNNVPSGFSVKLNSNISDDEVVKQITKLQLQDKKCEFILSIANFSNKAISAEIWRSS